MARRVLARVSILLCLLLAVALLWAASAGDPIGRIGGWLSAPPKGRGPRPDPGTGRRWRDRREDPEERPDFVGPPRPAQILP